MNVYTLIFFLTVVIVNISYSQIDKIQYDEKELALVSVDSNIIVDNFSNRTDYKLYECEFKYVKFNESKIYKYYLIDQTGKLTELDFKIDKLNNRLWYYEIFDSSIFVIINSRSFRDWIMIKQFNTTSGELEFNARGEIPCYKPFDSKVLDWQLGNNDCEWINFKTSEITYRSNQIIDTIFIDSVKIHKLKNSIFLYNWKTLDHDIIVDDLGSNYDAFSDGTLMKNIKFNKESGNFEYDYRH